MSVTTMTPPPQKSIDDVLSFRLAFKILKALVDRQLKPSEVAEALESNYALTNMHIEILEAEGVLTHIKFGIRIRYHSARIGRIESLNSLVSLQKNRD